jgi:hypothetical protein
MRFSDISKGVAATKPVSFRYCGKDVPTKVRAMSAGEEIEIIAKATKASTRDGVKDPAPGHAIYEAHVKAETIALCCIDPDSESGGLTFAGAAEVLQLDNDAMTILYEQQNLWQEEISPSVRNTTTKDLFAMAREVNERGDPFAFARLSLSTRWALQRFTAVLLFTSPAFKSLVTLYSEDSTFDHEALRAKIAATPTDAPPPPEEPKA